MTGDLDATTGIITAWGAHPTTGYVGKAGSSVPWSHRLVGCRAAWDSVNAGGIIDLLIAGKLSTGTDNGSGKGDFLGASLCADATH